METITLTEHPNHPNQIYNSECGFSMRREKGEHEGMALNNHWVLRKDGKFIDKDQFRNDLAKRHNMKCRRDR